MTGTTATVTAAVLCAAGTAVTTLGYALRVAFEHDRLLGEDDAPPRGSTARLRGDHPALVRRPQPLSAVVPPRLRPVDSSAAGRPLEVVAGV